MVILLASRHPEACHIFHVSNNNAKDLSTDELFYGIVKEKKTRTYRVMVRRNKHSTIRYQDDLSGAMLKAKTGFHSPDMTTMKMVEDNCDALRMPGSNSNHFNRTAQNFDFRGDRRNEGSMFPVL